MMNLRNSKFFRRIQMLRHISKERLRKEKDRKPLDCQLEKAFCESSGDFVYTHNNSIDELTDGNDVSIGNDNKKRVDKQKLQAIIETQKRKFFTKQPESQPPPLNKENNKVNGLIQLNNMCYHVECFPKANKVKQNDSLEVMPSVSSAQGSICVSNSRFSLIAKMARVLGFKVVKENKMWNILWTDSLPGVEIYKNMKRFQQINHFPGMMEICRKDLLSRNLNRMLKLYPKDYKIFPKTWMFPADYGEALNYANSRSKPKMFILKPDSASQGRGIWLTNDLKNISPTDRMICQTYISRPLLIDGYKFDLRVYALVTSVDPLRVFIYNEGLARLATDKYVEPSMHNSDNLFMHLTNYSVNKRNSQYELCDDDDCGSKRNFSAINNWMRRQNIDVDRFWEKIDDIVIKTILSAWPMLKHNYHACFPSHDKIQACFEILGFDILVDSKLKPYVLEVNHSPSFHTSELVDRQVKRPLIRDTLSLIGTVLADKKQILREDRKRIKQRLLKKKPGNVSQRSGVSNDSQNGHKTSSDTSTECPISALAQQIAWEESHLGDFRRIMPPNDPVKLNYYCQFYGQQNQASIYANTASSKKREEVAKKLRKELEERKLKQSEICARKICAKKFAERQKRRAALPRVIIERQRQEFTRNQAHWTPGFISAAEERLRATYMQMRCDVLKELKVTEMIYAGLYNAGNLTKTDIIKFPHLYRSLERDGKI